MEALVLIIVFAILIQFIVDQIKVVLGDKIMYFLKPTLLAMVLGVIFAFMFNIDFFTILGVQSTIPFLNYCITGLILSAGAPAIHELVSKLRETRNIT